MREITKIKKLNEIAKRNERINGRRETKMEREKRKVSDYNKNSSAIFREDICPEFFTNNCHPLDSPTLLEYMVDET
jgi:hypothetical protein